VAGSRMNFRAGQSDVAPHATGERGGRASRPGAEFEPVSRSMSRHSCGGKARPRKGEGTRQEERHLLAVVN
jgi:hypothetical protein